MPFKNLVDSNDFQNTNGKIFVKNNATNIEGVFAGGDCVNGGKEVVDAVQAGKDGAKAILEFLGIMNAELRDMNEAEPSAFNSLSSGIPNS